MTFFDQSMPFDREARSGHSSNLVPFAAAIALFALLGIAIPALMPGTVPATGLPDWHGNVAASGWVSQR